MEGSRRRHSGERSGNVGHLNMPERGREPEGEEKKSTVTIMYKSSVHQSTAPYAITKLIALSDPYRVTFYCVVTRYINGHKSMAHTHKLSPFGPMSKAGQEFVLCWKLFGIQQECDDVGLPQRLLNTHFTFSSDAVTS